MMSFLDNFRQWKMSDQKNERGNATEMKFLTVSHKIIKKTTLIFIYFINKRLTVALARNYRRK